MASNLTQVSYQVGPAQRRQRFGHSGGFVWLTGLSASGQSTLAMALEERLLACLLRHHPSLD